MVKNQNINYAEKILKWLLGHPSGKKPGLAPGQKLKIDSLTDNKTQFIDTVKNLIDENYVTDIEFSEDYTMIRRMSDASGYRRDIIEQYRKEFSRYKNL